MNKTLGLQWAIVMAGAMLLALAAACGAEKEIVEVVKEVVVEREVIKEVPVEKIVTEVVVKEVPVEVVVIKEVPVEKIVTEVVTKEVIRTVEVPVEKIVVVKEVVRTNVPVETIITKIVEKQVITVATPVPLGERQFYMTTLDANPRYGGTLKIAAHGPPAHFDAYASITIANIGAQNLMYDQLVRRDARRTPLLPVIPDLAHRWEISSDGMTYTFFLREGAKFHDGSDFGAEDVKATYDRIIFPPEDVGSYRQGVLETVKSIDVVDENTVAFTLSEFRSDSYLMQAFASGWNIINKKEVLEENNGDLKKVDNTPGTGPFKYLERTTESWTTERNPDYWNPHAPYVDRVEQIWLRVFTPESQAALLGGLVHFNMFTTSETLKEIKKRDDMSYLLWSKGVPGIDFAFNTQRKPFDDVRVRRAAHLAVDLEGYVDISSVYAPSWFNGDWFAANSVYARPLAEIMKELPWDYARRADAVTQAKALMADAGYADGYPGKLVFPVQETTRNQQWAALIQANLKEIGLDLDIQIHSASELFEVVAGGAYDIGNSGACPAPLLDPSAYFRPCFGTKADGTHADNNFARWINKDFNDILTKFQLEPDLTVRIGQAREMETILNTERPYLSGIQVGIIWGWNNSLRGMPVDGFASDYDEYQWDFVWLDN
jgi:ABC-type transport system substrate-binding protein